MLDDPPDDQRPLVEVGRFETLSQAREHGLVLAAMGIAHWVFHEGREFVLKVEEPAREQAREELAKYQAEPPHAQVIDPLPESKTSYLSLWIVAWLMGGFWFLQNLMPAAWLSRGEIASIAIVAKGEWWRLLTALTLHGDLSHLLANMAAGLLFAGFLIPQLGNGGISWLAILASGMLGNALNAWFYGTRNHLSIGASTAVFGALGLLVGLEVLSRFSSPRTRGRWQLILPVGAGLGLLAFLGTGNEHGRTDLMAHLWGFIAGLILSVFARIARIRERSSAPLAWASGILSLVILAGAWLCALRHESL